MLGSALQLLSSASTCVSRGHPYNINSDFFQVLNKSLTPLILVLIYLYFVSNFHSSRWKFVMNQFNVLLLACLALDQIQETCGLNYIIIYRRSYTMSCVCAYPCFLCYISIVCHKNIKLAALDWYLNIYFFAAKML